MSAGIDNPFVLACVRGVQKGRTFMQVAFVLRSTADRVRRAIIDYEKATGLPLPRSQNRTISPARRKHMRAAELRFEESYARLPRCGRCHLRGHAAEACDLGAVANAGWDGWTW